MLTQEEKLERQKQQDSKPKQVLEKKDRTKELFLNIDDPASDFTVQMVDGKEFTLSDL